MLHKLIIKNIEPENDVSKECYNLNQDGVKFLKTNNYYEVFSTKIIRTNYLASDNISTLFEQYGSNNIKILRPYDYTDPNSNHFFKNYKPIGDIIISDNVVSDESNSTAPVEFELSNENCKPFIKNGYTGKITSKLTNKETYLVSGNVKSPIDYELIYTDVKRKGLNKNLEALNVWKPIPPDGYKSLGLVIDTRPYQEGFEPPKPSSNLVACVPENITLQLEDSDNNKVVQLWTNNRVGLSGIGNKDEIKLYRNEFLNTFSNLENPSSHFKINEASTCKTYDELLKENPALIDELRNNNNVNTGVRNIEKKKKIKEKKFSILKLYE